MVLIRPRSWALSILLTALAAFLSSCGTSTSAIVNPTPTISGLFPSSITAGSDSFTMYIAGQNFLNGKIANTQGISSVYWNGSLRVSTYNQQTGQLAVSVLASDVASSGIAQVTVTNPSPGGGPSVATFTILPVLSNTPLISSISPTSANVGSQTVTITVNGTNFQSSSVIAFNGAPLCPTWVISPTQLVAQIDSSYFTAAAIASISVYTPTGGGGNLFSPGVTFTVGTVSGNNLTFPQVVSVSALGGAADGPSEAPAMSWDGRYVAFYSQAKNLVSEGASGNIFVRDTCLTDPACVPHTTAVDLAPEGTTPNGKVGRQVALSGDGRYVAFISRATNLIAGGAVGSGFTELYVRDLCTNAVAACAPHTELISVAADGSAADGPSSRPSLSSDGRFVAFESSATNLVSGAPHLQPQIYVRDTCTGSTAPKSCVAQTYSVPMDEQDQALFAQGARPAISATGRYVAFEAWTGSAAAQAAAPGATESAQVVLADTCLGPDAPAGCRPSASRVSLLTDGATISGSNFAPSLSANGRYVAFESQPVSSPLTNASAATTTVASRIFVRDTCNAAATACSPSTSQMSAESATASSGKTEVYSPSLSPSGRYISYLAGSPSSGSSTEGILQVRDMCNGAGKSCVARSYAVEDSATCSTGCQIAPSNCPAVPSSGVTADKFTAVPLSANGRFAAFYAPESTPAQPANGIGDIFMTLTPF